MHELYNNMIHPSHLKSVYTVIRKVLKILQQKIFSDNQFSYIVLVDNVKCTGNECLHDRYMIVSIGFSFNICSYSMCTLNFVNNQ